MFMSDYTQLKVIKLSLFRNRIFVLITLKPWPNGVENGRKLKTWVYLRLRLALRVLVLTCDDLCSLWPRSNLHASQTTGVPNSRFEEPIKYLK